MKINRHLEYVIVFGFFMAIAWHFGDVHLFAEGDQLLSLAGIYKYSNFHKHSILSAYTYSHPWQPLSYSLSGYVLELGRNLELTLMFNRLCGAVGLSLIVFCLKRVFEVSALLAIAVMLANPELITTTLYYNASSYALLYMAGATFCLINLKGRQPNQRMCYVAAAAVLAAFSALSRLEFLICSALLIGFLSLGKKPMINRRETLLFLLIGGVGFYFVYSHWLGVGIEDLKKLVNYRVNDIGPGSVWNLRCLAYCIVHWPFWIIIGPYLVYKAYKRPSLLVLYIFSATILYIMISTPPGITTPKYLLPFAFFMPFAFCDLLSKSSGSDQKRIRGVMTSLFVIAVAASQLLSAGSWSGNLNIHTDDGPRISGSHLKQYLKIRNLTHSYEGPAWDADKLKEKLASASAQVTAVAYQKLCHKSYMNRINYSMDLLSGRLLADGFRLSLHKRQGKRDGYFIRDKKVIIIRDYHENMPQLSEENGDWVRIPCCKDTSEYQSYIDRLDLSNRS